jgi:DNA polymerase-1
VDTPEKLDAMLESMKTAHTRAIDVETSGLSVLEDYITGISVSWQEGTGYYIPINHQLGANLDQQSTIEKLRPSFEDTAIINIAHGKKFDGMMLAALNFDKEWAKANADYATDLWLTAYANELGILNAPFERLGLSVTFQYDTMIMAYLTGKYARIGTGRSTASLKKIVQEELGIQMVFIEELMQKNAKGTTTKKRTVRIQFEKLDPDEDIPVIGGKIVKPYEYACADSDMTLRLFNRLLPKVKDLFLLRVDTGVIPLTKLMELNGVYANVEKMDTTYKMLTAEAAKVKQLVFRDVAEAIGYQVDFELGSPSQVGRILFEELKYPVIERSEKTGKALTNAKVLDVMGKDFPLVANILTWRSLRKNAEDFFNGMKDYISPVDKRIHCSYATAHVSSGRFASENPNMQNQPRLTEWKVFDKELPDGAEVSDEGHKFYTIKSNLRRCYEAIDEFYILEGDYSQIEYRVFAGRSQARALLDSYRDGADLHTRNASMIFGIPEAEVTKAIRTEAKTYSFGIMYGMGAGGIALRTGRSKAECQRLYDRYFEAIPEGKQHIRDITDAALQSGYITTHFGRQVWIPELKSPNRNLRFRGEREAFNLTIQGSAADILRIGMNRLTKQLLTHYGPRFNDKIKPMLTTHDSLAFMVHKSIRPEVVIELLKYSCEVEIRSFPIISMDFSVGPNYGEMLSWEKLRPTFNPNDARLGIGSDVQTLDEDVEYLDEHSESVSEPAAVGLKHVTDVLPVSTSMGAFEEPVNALVEPPVASPAIAVAEAPSTEALSYALVVRDDLTQTKAVQLKELLVHNPGKNMLTLLLPDAEVPMTGFPTSLGKSDEALFKVLFDCQLVLRTVDPKVLTKGLKM